MTEIDVLLIKSKLFSWRTLILSQLTDENISEDKRKMNEKLADDLKLFHDLVSYLETVIDSHRDTNIELCKTNAGILQSYEKVCIDLQKLNKSLSL